MFMQQKLPSKAEATKELKKNVAMLAVWCGVVRAIPYVLHALSEKK
jgi:hypothetical protein